MQEDYCCPAVFRQAANSSGSFCTAIGKCTMHRTKQNKRQSSQAYIKVRAAINQIVHIERIARTQPQRSPLENHFQTPEIIATQGQKNHDDLIDRSAQLREVRRSRARGAFDPGDHSSKWNLAAGLVEKTSLPNAACSQAVLFPDGSPVSVML